MAKKNVLKFIFRRIRGRIVRIKVNPHKLEKRIISAGGGALIGLTIGSVIAGSKNRRENRKLFRAASRGGIVNTKSFLKAKGFNKVIALTSKEDVSKTKFNAQDKSALNQLVKIARSGKNAFAANYKGRELIIAAPKSSRSIIGHELGHIKDFRTGGKPGFFNSGVIGTLTGATFRRESRAWELSAAKTKAGKSIALKSYERQRDHQRGGVIIGAATGIGFAIMKKKFGF